LFNDLGVEGGPKTARGFEYMLFGSFVSANQLFKGCGQWSDANCPLSSFCYWSWNGNPTFEVKILVDLCVLRCRALMFSLRVNGR
jgi:hypothetical protein